MFLQSFKAAENDTYHMPLAEIRDFNALIDNKPYV